MNKVYFEPGINIVQIPKYLDKDIAIYDILGPCSTAIKFDINDDIGDIKELVELAINTDETRPVLKKYNLNHLSTREKKIIINEIQNRVRQRAL